MSSQAFAQLNGIKYVNLVWEIHDIADSALLSPVSVISYYAPLVFEREYEEPRSRVDSAADTLLDQRLDGSAETPYS